MRTCSAVFPIRLRPRPRAIRELYPCKRVAGFNWGTVNFNKSGGNLPEPTDAMPGTDAKILVLQKRLEAGQILFHPDDAKDTDESKGYAAVRLPGDNGMRRAGRMPGQLQAVA